MKWYRKLTVGSRLAIVFTLMMAFMGVIGFTGHRGITQIEAHLEDIFASRMPAIDYLLQADRDLQQLLVAERSIIFAKTNSDVFKSLVADYEENLNQSEEWWKKYKTLADSPEEAALIPKYEQARKEWFEISDQIMERRKADTRQGRREALDLTLGVAKLKFEEMRQYLYKLTEINQKNAEIAEAESQATYQNSVLVLLSVLACGLLFGGLLMFTIGRGLTKTLKSVIENLSIASEQVASGASQVSTSSQQLAEGSSQQAASLEETSSSLEEMANMTQRNASNANHAKGMMGEVSAIVDKVEGQMKQMTQAIGEISQSSEETGKIIKTIDEIAFQTNLLALNAAVEAARAGEAGAGFAVVADEVRNLAMRAADAARSTAELIENTIRAVQNGHQLTTDTREAFQDNVEISSKVATIVNEIAVASDDQSQGINQVNMMMTEMDTVVQQVAANSEESASAAEEMNAQAKQMKASVIDLVQLVGEASDKKQRLGKFPIEAAPQLMGTAQSNVQIHSRNLPPSKRVEPEKSKSVNEQGIKNFSSEQTDQHLLIDGESS